MEKESFFKLVQKVIRGPIPQKPAETTTNPLNFLNKYEELKLLKSQFHEFPLENDIFKKFDSWEGHRNSVVESYLKGA